MAIKVKRESKFKWSINGKPVAGRGKKAVIEELRKMGVPEDKIKKFEKMKIEVGQEVDIEKL
ncbi:MAG: hypothetical protein GXO42_02105 [bacterium]|nr:hypothetical protein [bacterium]